MQNRLVRVIALAIVLLPLLAESAFARSSWS
jgi:hypothetical protein